MIIAYCLDCDSRLVLNPHAAVGQRITCPLCDSEFELISLEPLELDWAFDWAWDVQEEEEGLAQTSSLV